MAKLFVIVGRIVSRLLNFAQNEAHYKPDSKQGEWPAPGSPAFRTARDLDIPIVECRRYSM
jgi:hypothetical protein